MSKKLNIEKSESKILSPEELLQALKDLYSVRSNPFTDQQRQLKFEVECRVEEILKKYENK